MIFIDKTTIPMHEQEFKYYSREINEFEASYFPLGFKGNLHYFLYISKEHTKGSIKIKSEYIQLNYENDVVKICNEELFLTIKMVEYIYKWTKRLNKFKEEVVLYESIKQIIKKIELIE